MPPSTRTDADHAAQSGSYAPAERLYVAWQEPESREIRPVGLLTCTQIDGATCYEFRYLRGSQRRPFQPFVSFPELHRVYRSPELFPMFENRIMPPGRDDYLEYMGRLGLPANAPPFETLAASFGRRATDRVEVFAEPTIDLGPGLPPVSSSLGGSGTSLGRPRPSLRSQRVKSCGSNLRPTTSSTPML